jgi:hypothetical protein
MIASNSIAPRLRAESERAEKATGGTTAASVAFCVMVGLVDAIGDCVHLCHV